MRYASAANFRTALEQRLKTQAQQTGIPLVRLRKLVVFDRLMARLVVVTPDRWVLKGAVAILFRVGPRFRTTKDIDLGRQDNEESTTRDFLAAQTIDLEDYFTFAIERAGTLDPDTEGASVRYHVSAGLAGRPFEGMTVDVGFGDPALTTPDVVQAPDLLAFAGITPSSVPAIPLAQHVAEKLHAYTRTYSDGRGSTRVKDLVDLVAIASHFSLEAGQLRRALDSTFKVRASHSLPKTLPAPPADWGRPYDRMATEIGLSPSLEQAYAAASALLAPLLANEVSDESFWSPDSRSWEA